MAAGASQVTQSVEPGGTVQGPAGPGVELGKCSGGGTTANGCWSISTVLGQGPPHGGRKYGGGPGVPQHRRLFVTGTVDD